MPDKDSQTNPVNQNETWTGSEPPSPPASPDAPTIGAAQERPGAPGPPPGPQASRESIGGYLIVRQLGEGGMGVVYEAIQQNPERRVALKIIRGAGSVDDHAIRLFQREVRALARLKHPGIAAIYESGRTERGEHFFAMELVQGARLDEFVRRTEQAPTLTKSALRVRLELFLEICDAVSYAHQRGVIHRDLKPGNILAQELPADESGGPPKAEIKVLDFGLARIADEDNATQAGTLQGTLRYMSPEQVRGDTDQIDLRTDIYSLGVILFEMLSGDSPYNLDRTSFPKAARIICEQAPKRLNDTLSGKGTIHREVEVILRKALEKEPAARYQSVAALAEDIRRYLNNLPILAQPPSAAYQFRKLVARHKAGFGFAAALAVLVMALAVTMTIEAHRVAEQRDRANREAQVAGQVSGFLVNLFNVSQPDQSRGKTVTARELLDKGAASIERNAKMDPEVKATLLDTMGNAYQSLGFFDRAEPLLDQSLRLRTSLFSPKSIPVARSLRDLGLLALARGKDKEAYRDYLRSLKIYQQQEGPASQDVAILLNDVGTSLDHVGRLDEAQNYFRRALQTQIKVSGPDSAALIPMRSNLAFIAYSQKDYAGAEKQFRQELQTARKVYGPDHPDVAKLLNNLGGVLFTEKHYVEAEKYYRQALALDRKLLGDKHPQIALDLANIAQARDAQRNREGAIEDYRRALSILVNQVPDTDFRIRFVRMNLGEDLVLAGTSEDLREAEPMLRKALAANNKTLPKGAWDTAEAESLLGGCLLAEKRYAAAQPLLVESYPTIRDKIGPHQPSRITDALQRIIRLFREWGKPGKAREYEAMLKTRH